MNGYVNSFTTSLLLENEIIKKKFSYGFNFGAGITRETIQPNQFNNIERVTNYPTITLGSHISYNISKDFDLQISPVILWQDPYKCIGVLTRSRKANFAGEDLSCVVNVGIKYRIVK